MEFSISGSFWLDVFLRKDKPFLLMEWSHQLLLAEISESVVFSISLNKIKAFFTMRAREMHNPLNRRSRTYSKTNCSSFSLNGFLPPPGSIFLSLILSCLCLDLGVVIHPVNSHSSVDITMVSSSTFEKLFCMQNNFHFKCRSVTTNCISFVRSNQTGASFSRCRDFFLIF